MTVSLIIPVFNGEATIARAIDSALDQSFTGGLEIIVVNDGSTDSTAEVLTRYGQRIGVVNQENRGAAAARNAGATFSGGPVLAILENMSRVRPSTITHPKSTNEWHDTSRIMRFS